jgi:hypothetical protein
VDGADVVLQRGLSPIGLGALCALEDSGLKRSSPIYYTFFSMGLLGGIFTKRGCLYDPIFAVLTQFDQQPKLDRFGLFVQNDTNL